MVDPLLPCSLTPVVKPEMPHIIYGDQMFCLTSSTSSYGVDIERNTESVPQPSLPIFPSMRMAERALERCIVSHQILRMLSSNRIDGAETDLVDLQCCH